MTIRAVDMQTMIPRLNEASRLQHQNDLHPQVANHAQAGAFQQKMERAQHQVGQLPTAEQATIQKDGKGSGGDGRGQGQQRPRAKRPEEKKETAGPSSGRRLDVKV